MGGNAVSPLPERYENMGAGTARKGGDMLTTWLYFAIALAVVYVALVLYMYRDDSSEEKKS